MAGKLERIKSQHMARINSEEERNARLSTSLNTRVRFVRYLLLLAGATKLLHLWNNGRSTSKNNVLLRAAAGDLASLSSSRPRSHLLLRYKSCRNSDEVGIMEVDEWRRRGRRSVGRSAVVQDRKKIVELVELVELDHLSGHMDKIRIGSSVKPREVTKRRPRSAARLYVDENALCEGAEDVEARLAAAVFPPPEEQRSSGEIYSKLRSRRTLSHLFKLIKY